MPVMISPTLAVGDQFPRLQLHDHDGNAVTFEPASAVVIFYRGHWCDHCCAQLVGLADDIDGFRSPGARIIAISADDQAGALAMHHLVGDAITVLVDRDSAAIAALGLREIDEESQRVVARPSVYIVDGAGLVRYRYIGKTIQDRPKPALLLLGVESMLAAR